MKPTIEELAAAVERMLMCQKLFFRTHSKSALCDSRLAERKVDDLLIRLRQSSLFEEDQS